MKRIYFLAPCQRCGTLGAAQQDSNGNPSEPFLWGWRGVPVSWAFGGTPDDVLACKVCSEFIDETMRTAWTRAVERPGPQAILQEKAKP